MPSPRVACQNLRACSPVETVETVERGFSLNCTSSVPTDYGVVSLIITPRWMTTDRRYVIDQQQVRISKPTLLFSFAAASRTAQIELKIAGAEPPHLKIFRRHVLGLSLYLVIPAVMGAARELIKLRGRDWAPPFNTNRHKSSGHQDATLPRLK